MLALVELPRPRRKLCLAVVAAHRFANLRQGHILRAARAPTTPGERPILESTNERTAFVRNALTSYGSRALLLASALVLTPYLFRTLGEAGFGTWSVIFALATVFNLLEVGISAGLIRFVAEHRAAGERAALLAVARAGAVVMASVGLLAAGLAVLAAFALDGLAAERYRDDFRLGLLVLAGAMLVRFTCVAAGAVLNGYQRYDLTNASLALTTVGSLVGSIVAVEAGLGVFGVALAHALALVVGGLAYVGLLLKVDRELVLGRRGAGAQVRNLLGFSSYTFLADSMIFVGQRMDVVVIAAVRNAATAAPYAAALKLQSGIQSLTLPLIDMLMPMFSSLWAGGRREEAARRLTLATRATLQVTLPLAAGIALFAPDIVRLWLGEGAPGVTTTIIVYLMAVQCLTLAPFAAEKALIAVGRVRAIGTLALFEGVGNVCLSIVLTVRYGAVGPAIGTLLTNGLLAPIRFPLACRALGWPLRRFLRESVGVALLSSVPALALLGGLFLTLPDGALRAVAGPAAGLLLALAVAAHQLRGRGGIGRGGRRVSDQGDAGIDARVPSGNLLP